MRLGHGLAHLSFQVGKSGLIGSTPFKWLDTNTTSPADLQSAGTLTAYNRSASPADTGALSRTASQVMIINIDLEFKGPIDTTISLNRANPRAIRTITHSVLVSLEQNPESKQDEKKTLMETITVRQHLLQ
jgi:hypothetical protein